MARGGVTLGELVTRSEQAAGAQRRHTRWETGVDGAVHAVAILAGILGAVGLLWLAASRGSAGHIAVAAIYSTSLIAMFSCSAAYNLNRWSPHGNWLRNLDQAAIFVMIAGSYTPFTIFFLEGPWRVALTTIIWSLCAVGIVIRLCHGRLFDRISLALYLGLGWIGLVALVPLVGAVDLSTLALLVGGGLLYTAGVLFHLWERLPFQNAIWHGFVLAAATVHFVAVAGTVAALGPA